MALVFPKCLSMACLLCVCNAGISQQKAAVEASAAHEPASVEPVPRVPGVQAAFRKVNAGISFNGVHDSTLGWYTVVTPAISYTFNQHFSADTSVSIYPYRLVERLDEYGQVTSTADVAEVGDALLGVHAAFSASPLQNTATAILTIPTGSKSVGLGTGQVTFDLSDRLELPIHKIDWILDLGGGNSAGLFNTLVSKDYTSLGPLVHFQAGAAFWPIPAAYMQLSAYEAMPLGSQTIYTAAYAGNGQYSGSISHPSTSEDNGFTALAGIPLTSHVSLSGYYDRSLRHSRDTVSIGLTFTLRGSGGKKRLSLIDRALREAEGAEP